VLCHVFQNGARFHFVSVVRQVADRVEVMKRERPEVFFRVLANRLTAGQTDEEGLRVRRRDVKAGVSGGTFLATPGTGKVDSH
jgi:hypothetical protein